MTDTPNDDTKANHTKLTGNEVFAGAIWWSILVVAVIAIPAFAAAITLALPFGQTAQIIVFMVTCWLCTWLGMWLMKKAK